MDEARAAAANFRERFRTGVGWNSIGTIFSQGSTFAVNVIVANALGRRTFGEYAIVLGTLATFSNVAQLAMGFTATRFLAELRGRDKERAGSVLAACALFSAASATLVSLALFLSARGLAVAVYREPDLAVLFALASAALLFSVLNGFLLGSLAGLEAYRKAGFAGVASGGLYVLACVAGVRFGLPGVLVGIGAGGLAQALLLAGCLRSECLRQGIFPRWSAARRERDVILHFAAPAALAGLSQMSALWLAGVLLARQADGIAQTALFAAANNFWIALMFLPNIVNNVGLSLLNHTRGRGDLVGFRRLFWSTVRVNALVTVLGGGLCAVAAPALMALFGREFSAGVSVLTVLLISAAPCAFWFAASQVVASDGNMWRVLVSGALPRDVSLVALTFFLAPRWGALGLAAAVCGAWAVGVLSIVPTFLRSMASRGPVPAVSA